MFVHFDVRSMQQMLEYDGDDFQDVFSIAFEVTELWVYKFSFDSDHGLQIPRKKLPI